jgi:hypothetical protein
MGISEEEGGRERRRGGAGLYACVLWEKDEESQRTTGRVINE